MIRLRNCLLALFGLLLLTEAQPAQAQFEWGGEKIIKIADLPNDPEFRHEREYVDIGAIYKQVTILFIPVYNYDVRWAGYIGSSGDYLKLSERELRDLADEAGVRMPRDIELPFWDAWGGKLAIFGVVLLVVLLSVLKGRRRRAAAA